MEPMVDTPLYMAAHTVAMAEVTFMVKCLANEAFLGPTFQNFPLLFSAEIPQLVDPPNFYCKLMLNKLFLLVFCLCTSCLFRCRKCKRFPLINNANILKITS